MTGISSFLPRTRIAYFSMEIAIREEMTTYAGGLGVLAGDTMRSAADLAMPMVFVTLASRAGYLRQELDGTGNQTSGPDPWEPSRWTEPLDAMIALRIEGRAVWVRPWLHIHQGASGGSVPVLLLDTWLDQNAAEDRSITDRLYGGDDAYRLRQEAVLGVGGLRILHALGFDIDTFHMNEGHSALLAASLLTRYPHPPGHADGSGLSFDADRVREQCVFTTHTPVEAGHDRFDYALAERLIGDLLPFDQVRLLAGTDQLNMTRLALNLSDFVNGVAERHAETARKMYPSLPIREITNGVHLPSWVHPAKAALLDDVAPHWRHEPEDLVNADLIRDGDLQAAHRRAKADLLHEVKRRTGVSLDPEVPLIAFARRMTGYKSPDLLFEDLDRLRKIVSDQPFQLVMAGKAHPADKIGQDMIRLVHRHMRTLSDCLPSVFLCNYDVSLARALVSGADIWLNTPLPPLKASGGGPSARTGAPPPSTRPTCTRSCPAWSCRSGTRSGTGGGGKSVVDRRPPSWLRCAIAAASRTGPASSFLGRADWQRGTLAGRQEDEMKSLKMLCGRKSGASVA